MNAPAPSRAPLSAFVITYNRADTIGTCLAALGFADEIIVIDKSSTDGTHEIAARYADRVIRVPWSPTPGATRAFAVEQCRHDWILFLDDDECLSAEAVLQIDAELRSPSMDIYQFARREYVLGEHNESACYHFESHPRLFRRGTVEMVDVIHDEIKLLSDRVGDFPIESGACIHHLSHSDIAVWLGKTNRYTSQQDRVRMPKTPGGLFTYAHRVIDFWESRTRPCEPDSYPQVIALLKSVYDIVDRLKTWEEERGLDGAALFATKCAELQEEYRAKLQHLTRPRRS